MGVVWVTVVGGGTPDGIIETTLQHNPESHDERIMTTQPLNATNRTPSWGGGTPSGTPGAPPPVIACTRFNNKTWQDYQTWLSAYQQSYEQTYHRPLKCIYGAPREISHKKIPPQAKILVIEMNNDENKIMGIGEIQNQTASETYKPVAGGAPPPPFRKIFSDRNYTRYIYIGNTRYASREELERNHTEDAQYINAHLANIITLPQTPHPPEEPTTNILLEYLEILLFKGARHMKRGTGITRVAAGVAPPNGAAGVAPPNGAATLDQEKMSAVRMNCK